MQERRDIEMKQLEKANEFCLRVVGVVTGARLCVGLTNVSTYIKEREQPDLDKRVADQPSRFQALEDRLRTEYINRQQVITRVQERELFVHELMNSFESMQNR